ncbi:MAG: hypothetical protein GY696_11255 [Gammaproteobacteria bacterium]|nr:hypothetical protein [Gammaproteobacteria bacterium]
MKKKNAKMRKGVAVGMREKEKGIVVKMKNAVLKPEISVHSQNLTFQ